MSGLLQILVKNDMTDESLEELDKKYIYNNVCKYILKRVFLVGYHGASLGGESAEEVIYEALMMSGLTKKQINWSRFSKKAAGYDLTIGNSRMSLKTCIQKNISTIVVTSYSLTQCKTFKEHIKEITKRDESYDKCLLFIRKINPESCYMSLYEIDKDFFDIDEKYYTKTKRGFHSKLINGFGKVYINLSSTHKLSYTIDIKSIEKFKIKEFTIFKKEAELHTKKINKYIEDIIHHPSKKRKFI
jgi:hypothetical protein